MSESQHPWTQEGRFWLPGQRSKTLGRVDYSPDGGNLLLHLPESPLPSSDPGDDLATVDVLYGETLDGWPFTLLDGVVMRPDVVTADTSGVADVRFACLVRGPHVTAPEEIIGTLASVHLRGLHEFLTGGRAMDNGLLAATPERRESESVSVRMPWGSLGLYVAGGPTKISRNEVHYAVHAHAQFEFDDEVTLGHVDRAVEPLRDLVAFSTRSPSVITSLHLLGASSPEGVHWQHRREFEVVRPPELPLESIRSRGGYALLLNPATIPDGAEIIARWYELRERLGPVWWLFFATLVDPWMTSESQLLSLTSFAEGYHRTLHDAPPFTDEEAAAATARMLAALPDRRHRQHYDARLRHANSQSQRARIRWLTKRALSVVPVWEVDSVELAGQAVDTRNWLTHWGDRGADVQEGGDLTLLSARLYVVLAINILLDIGLEADVAARQITSGLRGQALP